MKDRDIYICCALIAIMLLTAAFQCTAQVYSSVASAQVKHAVDTEKPVIKYDTVRIYAMPADHLMILSSFTYKDFVIEIRYEFGKVHILVYAGKMELILRPDDEYAILEKLTPLAR